jgi:hypothetical protein
MPIYRLIQSGVFSPELVSMMGEVFEDILKTLNLADRNDPVTELVAHKVIELVQSGVRDPIRLKQLALEAFQGQRPAS